MKPRAVVLSILLVLGILTAPLGWAAGLLTVSPEQVGLSAERLARIGTAITTGIKQGQFPGAVALVARKGRIAYFESFGLIDNASGVPMPKDAIFRLTSMTKPFTSVAAMILVEEGRLILNDPVSKFLPPFAKMEVSVQQLDPATGKASYATVPAERQITIQDLLRHTSGLVYGWATTNAPLKELYTTGRVGASDLTPTEQIERLAKVPLAHQPGAAFEYGMSTDILGRVIEAITEVTLGKFFEQRIFTPLKMTDSGFFVPQDTRGRLAQPFATNPLTGNPIRLAEVTTPPKNDSGGAGGVGTAGDYVRFLQMMLNGGQLDGIRLLNRTTVRHMTSDHLGEIRRAGTVPLRPPLGFGLGFAVRKETGIHFSTGSVGEYFWSGASGTGFWVDPKEELICIWMTQGAPGAPRDYDRFLFKELVYQAIND
jgi:CubicO group peptidase (beta-lactamase class C family)